MRKFCLFVLVCFLCLGAFSQEITLSFVGQLNDSEYCPMDSVVVTNVSRNWTESVVYPDTIIVVGGTVGNNLNIVTNMGLEQNVPNPFDCETRVELAVLKREDVRMQLLDVAGHVCAEYTGSLNEGVHVFDISAANPQTYILNAILGSRSYSIRMVNVGSGCGCSIKYSGLGKGIVRKFETTNEFELGNDMQYVGYATIDGDLVVSDTVEQSLTENQCVTLHFTRSLPQVETLVASSVTNLSAILHGRITGTGGSSIIACGFYYGTSEDDLSQNVTATLTDNVFSYELADLTFGTTYYYQSYAINNVGTGYGEVRLFTTDSSLNGHDFVDLGLPSGTLWATCNVGATSPEDYGDYFAWGETVTKDSYSHVTYLYCNGSTSALTKYCNDTSCGYNGFTDTLTMLQPSDDAATANWGEGWRIPTKEEFNELLNNCTGTWTTRNGVNGYLFTGTNGNSIFLPAAGLIYGAGSPNVGSRGAYWTNSIYNNPVSAWDFYFNSGSCTTNDCYLREYGLSVRAVCITAPVVRTKRAAEVNSSSAIIKGNVSYDGGADVTERGFVYGTSEDNLTETLSCGSGIGNFSANLTSLVSGTTYYYKAYAINSAGIGYGEVKSFIAEDNLPVDIIMEDGIALDVECGQLYNFYDSGGADDTYSDNERMTATITSVGLIKLSFSSFIVENSGLGYMRVYDGDDISGITLINTYESTSAISTYTAYSGMMTIVWESYGSSAGWEATISADCPLVRTTVATNVTMTSATLNGIVSDSGIAAITGCGFYYGTREDSLLQNVTANIIGNMFSYELSGLASGTTYYYRAYAINSEDTSFGEVRVVTTGGALNGHDFIDLGLPSGTLWATCNVGATAPEGYGDYFAWGEITPKETYSSSNYVYFNSSKITKYCNDSRHGYNGFTDTLTTLQPSDDAATANWGASWRMPTKDELDEMKEYCTKTSTNQNGVEGYMFTGPNGNTIFMPVIDVNYLVIHYWSSSLCLDSPSNAWFFNIFYGANCDTESRHYGLSVRAVCSPGQN